MVQAHMTEEAMRPDACPGAELPRLVLLAWLAALAAPSCAADDTADGTASNAPAAVDGAASIDLPAGLGIDLTLEPADTRGMDGRQIMLLNERSRRAEKSEVGKVVMTLRDRDSGQRVRGLRFIIDDTDELDRKTFVEFREPADVAGVRALSIANADGEDERWLYLPAIDQTLRVSESAQTASFLGTDFTFEDFSVMDGKAAGAERAYRVLGEQMHEGRRCWVIEARPATEALRQSSGHAMRLIWVEKEHYIAVTELFFDRDGKPFKRMKRGDIRATEGAHSETRPHLVTMETFETGHVTELAFVELALNLDFDPALFDPSKLGGTP